MDSREEYLLNAIAEDENLENFESKSREEEFLKRIALGENVDDLGVKSRKELLLKKISEKGGSGGVIEPLTITENGTYTAPEGVNGYNPVEVNVSNDSDMLQQRVNYNNTCDFLFYNYSGNNVDYIANLDTSNVTSMYGMFASCTKLITIPELDTSNVTDLREMFLNCNKLTTIPALDTGKATTMYRMFKGCKSLTTIPVLDAGNVTNMNEMFSYCPALKTVPALDASNVTSINSIFGNCTSLKSILMTGIKLSFSISSSTQFEQSDLVTILNNLATVTTTQTLTMGATNLAKLTDEDKTIATNKGWTLA